MGTGANAENGDQQQRAQQPAARENGPRDRPAAVMRFRRRENPDGGDEIRYVVRAEQQEEREQEQDRGAELR